MFTEVCIYSFAEQMRAFSHKEDFYPGRNFFSSGSGYFSFPVKNHGERDINQIKLVNG